MKYLLSRITLGEDPTGNSKITFKLCTGSFGCG